MSDPPDLVAWLNAVLDKREQTAADIESVGLGNLLPAAIIDGTGATVYFTPEADARIVAALSPDAMRRAVAAKRKILAEHETDKRWPLDRSRVGCRTCRLRGDIAVDVEWPCLTLRLLAEEFDGEPGYDAQSWAP